MILTPKKKLILSEHVHLQTTKPDLMEYGALQDESLIAVIGKQI